MYFAQHLTVYDFITYFSATKQPNIRKKIMAIKSTKIKRYSKSFKEFKYEVTKINKHWLNSTIYRILVYLWKQSILQAKHVSYQESQPG